MNSVTFGANVRVDKSLSRKDPLLARALKRYIKQNPDAFNKTSANVRDIEFNVQQRAKFLDEVGNALNPRQKSVPGYSVTRADGVVFKSYLDYNLLGGNRLFRFLPPLEKRIAKSIDKAIDFANRIGK